MRSRSHIVCAAALALGCGSGESQGPGGPGGGANVEPGTFVWTNEGVTVVSRQTPGGVGAGYVSDVAADGSSFFFAIQGVQDPAGCTLVGMFAALVPPAPGTYAIVGSATQPQPVDTFTGSCSGATGNGLYYTGGHVTMTMAETARIAGSFVIEAASPTTTITGGFDLTCNPLLLGCGQFSDSGWTCADLNACCTRVAATAMNMCMASYQQTVAGGDAACSRQLSLSWRKYCP